MSPNKYSQNIAFSSNSYKEEKDYWQKQLAGDILTSTFPFNSCALETILHQDFEILKFPQELSQKLFTLSNRNPQALFTVFLTGVFFLLHKYTQKKDLTIGIPAYGSKLNPDTFTFLRVNIDREMSFKELLFNCKKVVMEAQKYSNLSVQKIMEEIKGYPKEYLLPKTLVCLKNNQQREISQESSYDTCDTCFTFSFEEEIIVNLKYNPLLYDGKAMTRLLKHLVKYFTEVVADYDLKLKDIDILDTEEKQQLHKFNSFFKKYSGVGIPHKLFEEEVVKNPKRIALFYEDEYLTYEELNNKANQLAIFLRAKGIKPNNPVGLMVERSPEMIIGVLGILKAGGAYLPLDPNYPLERLAYMLNDSKAKLVVTSEQLLPQIKSIAREIVDIAEILKKSCPEKGKENLAVVNVENDLAYIIYTSGTTGKPKGVMIENRSVSSLVGAMGEVVYKQYGDNLKVAMVAPLIFDSSVEVIFASLLLGHTLFIVPELTRMDGERLLAYLVKHSIDLVDGTPAHVNLLAKAKGSFQDLSLKGLIVGGEEFKKELLIRFLTRFSSIKPTIINTYGPTECCSDATSFTMTESDQYLNRRNIPIGRPLTNTKIYILGKEGDLQPFGVPGEICIGGEGLARGYADQPELTKEKFIANPFARGEFLYKTGDLGRWLSDGNLEFLGRIDRQIKIKGYRIELKEIEDNLLALPVIKEALVVIRPDERGDKYLCAFFEAKERLGASILRSHLEKHLPTYMIPRYFIQLESLPLTASGKVDKGALPDPLDVFEQEFPYYPPTNAKEKELVEVWQDVLAVERIGVKDNFWALGGDSLKAMAIYARLTKKFSIQLPDLFVQQDIRSLAQHISWQEDYWQERILNLKEEYGRSKPKISLRQLGSLIWAYKDYQMKAKVYKKKKPQLRNYNNVLLTGATGYLGIHILYEFLTETSAHLYLLIRDKEKKIAHKRLEQKMSYYFGDGFYEKYKGRLTVLTGDLRAEKLGIKDDKIIKEIDYIIHAAANVNQYGNYTDFYETNIKGTKRIIDFALEKDIELGYISTMGLGFLNNNKKGPRILTEFTTITDNNVENFYLQSKIAAEKLIIEAKNKGLRYKILRVGNLVFNSENGKFQENINSNAFYMLIQAFLTFGTIPKSNIEILEFSFIDYVAKAVVLLSRLESNQEIYHICNKNRLSPSYLRKHLVALGYKLKEMEWVAFVSHLAQNFDDGLNDSVSNIILFADLFGDINGQVFILSKQTDKVLKSLGFKWLKVNREHLKDMVAHCQDVGFLMDPKT